MDIRDYEMTDASVTNEMDIDECGIIEPRPSTGTRTRSIRRKRTNQERSCDIMLDDSPRSRSKRCRLDMFGSSVKRCIWGNQRSHHDTSTSRATQRTNHNMFGTLIDRPIFNLDNLCKDMGALTLE